LEAGKHVISEVPAVWSLEEAEQLLNAVRRSKSQYFFAENCCYWHFVEVWRDWVAEGELGRIIYAEAEYVHDCRRIMRDANGLTWRATMPPIYYCTHSLGPLLKIMGGRFVSVTGLSTGVNVAPELSAIDLEVALLQHDSGAVVKLLCGFSIEREPAHHYFVVYGTQGCVEKSRFDNRTMAHLKDSEEYRKMATTPFTTNHPAPPEGATAGGHGTCEYFMLRDFLDALRDDHKPPIDIAQGLAMTLPGICAHRSAGQGGKMVEIPDLKRET
jgi:predicted dehydrogenase